MLKKFTYVVLAISVMSCGNSNKPKNGMASSTDSSNTTQSTTEKTPKQSQTIDLSLKPDESEPEYTTLNQGKTTSKILENTRYNFTIQLPDNWKAAERSKNGDGYYLYYMDADKQPIDVRVFGETIDPELDEILESNCIELSDFTFNDGFKGVKCIGNNSLSLYRDLETTRIQFYVGNVSQAGGEMLDELIAIAKTLRFNSETKTEKNS